MNAPNDSMRLRKFASADTATGSSYCVDALNHMSDDVKPGKPSLRFYVESETRSADKLEQGLFFFRETRSALCGQIPGGGFRMSVRT